MCVCIDKLGEAGYWNWPIKIRFTYAVGFLISGSCMLQMKAKEICEVLRADTVLSEVYGLNNAALLVDTHY